MITITIIDNESVVRLANTFLGIDDEVLMLLFEQLGRKQSYLTKPSRNHEKKYNGKQSYQNIMDRHLTRVDGAIN